MVGRGGGDRTLYPLNTQCFQRLKMKGQEHLLFIQSDLALRKPAIVAARRPAKPISRYIIRRCEIGTWCTNPRAHVFMGRSALHEVAQSQQGFFTTKQAIRSGFADKT